MMAKILGDIVGDAEGGQRAPGHQHLLAGLDDLDQLGGVGVQVHHVAGLLGRLGPGVHGHRDIRLGQGRGIVGAVAGHGHQSALALVFADQGELGLRRGLGEEVVHPGLGGDGRGGEAVVAGDHDGLDTHAPQLREALLDAALDDVLELDHAQHAGAIGHHQGGAAAPGDGIDDAGHLLREGPALRLDMAADGLRRALADLALT